MRENCFLFDSCYPFGHGETFLETEINYLAKKFKKIYIFSFTSNTKYKRITPNNISVFSLNLTSFPFKRIIKLFFGICSNLLPISEKKLRRRIDCFYRRGTVTLAYKKVIKILKKNKIDVQNSVFYSYWLSETALTAIKVRQYFKDKNIKLISRGHGSDIYDYAQSSGFNAFKKYAIENLDQIFCISEHGKKYLCSLYPNFRQKISVSRLGVQVHDLKTIKKGEGISFVTCSNIIPLKRVLFFGRAFKILVEKNLNIHWYCFGDGSEYNELKNFIEENQLKKCVTLFGRKTNEFVLNFYNETYIDYFVNVSSSEGIPVSIMEAMSFGIPAVATDVGGVSELVNKSTGFLLDSNISIDDLAKQLFKITKLNNKEIEKIRSEAFDMISSKFNCGKNYYDFVEKIIKFL